MAVVVPLQLLLLLVLVLVLVLMLMLMLTDPVSRAAARYPPSAPPSCGKQDRAGRDREPSIEDDGLIYSVVFPAQPAMRPCSLWSGDYVWGLARDSHRLRHGMRS